MYPLGAGGGVRIGGVQVSDYSMCIEVALCVVEVVGLVAAAVGWRMSSWLDDTGVLCVLAGCTGLLSIELLFNDYKDKMRDGVKCVPVSHSHRTSCMSSAHTC